MALPARKLETPTQHLHSKAAELLKALDSTESACEQLEAWAVESGLYESIVHTACLAAIHVANGRRRVDVFRDVPPGKDGALTGLRMMASGYDFPLADGRRLGWVRKKDIADTIQHYGKRIRGLQMHALFLQKVHDRLDSETKIVKTQISPQEIDRLQAEAKAEADGF